MHHTLKIDPQFWPAIVSGNKTFEVRINDRGFQKGDTVRFIAPKIIGEDTTLEPKGGVYVITYVLQYKGIESGYVVFSFKPFRETDNSLS